MGEAKRGKVRAADKWPGGERAGGLIELRTLSPVSDINGERLRAVLGDPTIPADQDVVLQTFAASVGDRTFHVGFTLGDESGVSAVGALVMERLAIADPNAKIHVVPITHEDIAWDIALRHLRSFTGRVLLFVFPSSDVYDAGSAEKYYSSDIRMIDCDGARVPQLSAAQRHRMRLQKSEILDRPRPLAFDVTPGIKREDAPWIFAMRTPTGKSLLTAVWNGRRDYAHEMPEDICRWVGGDRIAIVQVDRPVGRDRRSSLDLTHKLAKEFDGVIHWARDTETFQSIVASFVRLDIHSIAPPDLCEPFSPEVVFLLANTDAGS